MSIETGRYAMSRKFIPLSCLLLVGVLSWGQVTSDFSLTLNPSLNVPLAPSLSDGTAFYSLGGGVSIKAEYSLPFAQFLYTGIAFDADMLPINSSTSTLVLLSVGPELGVQFFPIPRLSLRVAGFGGMYAGMVSAGTVLDPFVGGLASVDYLINPSFSVGAGVAWKYSFLPTDFLYQGLSISAGVAYHVGAEGSGALKVVPAIQPIFPLFYSYYDKNPAGSMTIRNNAAGPIQDVQVSFFVKQFMDQPKVSWTWKELGRGEEKTFDVFALFKDSIFTVTESTKVAGEISVTYTYLGSPVTNSYPVTVTINNRNGMTWDDTRKAAAFVTSNDMNVRGFAARAVPDARSRGNPAINAPFRSAMALFDALNVHGMAYIPDPKAFASKVENKEAVDYLQFPSQTLETRAGDCDDLSILYASLLESAGIATAFITVPGHIYVAFDTELAPRVAAAMLGSGDDLIVQEDTTWIPVEITRVKDGFLKAWRSGAQEWKAAEAGGNAQLTPIHGAWEKFPPANTGDAIKVAVSPPDSERVYASYTNELKAFWVRDFQPRVKKLQTDLTQQKDDPALLAKLGLLYARFGMYEDARIMFERIVLTAGENPAALINLGNIAYLNGSNESALGFYQRALRKSSGNSAALQGIAKAGYEIGDTETVRTAMQSLKEADPDAASRMASLGLDGGGSGRAASAEKEITSWTEE
jgi:transglutaminase-like putative cysteine protease